MFPLLQTINACHLCTLNSFNSSLVCSMQRQLDKTSLLGLLHLSLVVSYVYLDSKLRADRVPVINKYILCKPSRFNVIRGCNFAIQSTITWICCQSFTSFEDIPVLFGYNPNLTTFAKRRKAPRFSPILGAYMKAGTNDRKQNFSSLQPISSSVTGL